MYEKYFVSYIKTVIDTQHFYTEDIFINKLNNHPILDGDIAKEIVKVLSRYLPNNSTICLINFWKVS